MANNLRSLREAKGWTQSQAAEALGTTRNQFVKLENGARRLSDVWIERAASAFGVDAGELVRGSGPLMVGRVTDEAVLWDAGEPAAGLTELGLLTSSTLGPMLAEGVIAFRHERRAPTNADDRRLFVVGLESGDVRIGRLFATADRRLSTFHLAGPGPPLFDLRPTWVSPVKRIEFDPPRAG